MTDNFPKIIQEVLEKHIEKINQNNIWAESIFQPIKHDSTTGKGDFGQNLLVELLKEIGIPAEVVNGGIGDYDIYLPTYNLKIEAKFATQDTNKRFQFNAFDKTKDYDLAMVVGCTPTGLYFDFIEKSEIQKLTTSQTKADGGFKMNRGLNNMKPLTAANFQQESQQKLWVKAT